MKELELMGVQEMDAIETRNRSGGIISLGVAGLVVGILALAIYIVDNREKVAEGFKEGYNAAIND